jgi:hypothetical protein
MTQNKYRHWTVVELQILQEEYQDKRNNIKTLAHTLGRSYSAIRWKAKRLGLKRCDIRVTEPTFYY